MTMPAPQQPIWHLAELEHWTQAQTLGFYDRSTRGASLGEVGFIHASTERQLPTVAETFYRDSPGPLVVLELDQSVLADQGSPVVFEPADPADPESELYPHIYGPIPLVAVVNVYRSGFDSEGRFHIEEEPMDTGPTSG